MKKIITLMVISMLLLIGCSNEASSYQTIDMEQAKQMIDEQSDIVILDVRTEEEFTAGHIPNAVLYPVQELETKLTELDKDKTYLVICRSGNRSKTASEILINHGFKHVYNTSGGMNEWQYEVEIGK